MAAGKEDAITSRQTLRILQMAAAFLALALIINLAVYGWLGAMGSWSAMEASAGDRLAHLLIAATFTMLAASTWYVLSFVVRPF